MRYPVFLVAKMMLAMLLALGVWAESPTAVHDSGFQRDFRHETDSVAAAIADPAGTKAVQERYESDVSASRSLWTQDGTEREHAQEMPKQQRPRWILLTVFLLFLAVAAIRAAFPGDFGLIVRAFYQNRTFRHIGNADNTLTSWPYVLMFLVFSLAIGMFIVLLDGSFIRQEPLTGGRFLQTAFMVGVLFVLKILTTRLVGSVFGRDRIARWYIAVLYMLYFNGAFFLMAFLTVAIFAPEHYIEPILIASGAVIIVLGYRFLQAVARLFLNLKFSGLYLIAYLCVLEIAPIVVLIKFLVLNKNKINI